MNRYQSKRQCWFDEGSFARLSFDLGWINGIHYGLFVGRKNGSVDEEICDFKDFKIIYP